MRKLAWCTLLFFMSAKAAYAADFHCPAGNTACLIAAIHAANGNGQENTIFLDAGEYRVFAIDNNVLDVQFPVLGLVDDGPNGLPSITGQVTIRGPEGIGSTLVRDENAPDFRIFHVEASGSLSLSWVNLTGGRATHPIVSFRPYFGGGAIRSHGTLSINNSILFDNLTFGEGGAVSSGPHFGGGRLTIRHSTIRNNRATQDPDSTGGGIYSRGSALIEDTFIHNNGVGGDGGGGGIDSGGDLLLRRTTIARNSTFSNGAGIDASGKTWIEDSSIYENATGSSDFGGGGGIRSFGSMTIVSSTVSNNRSKTGGIENWGSLTLRNTTVTGNLGDVGLGVGGVSSTSGSGPVLLENSIVALNFKSTLSRLLLRVPSDCGLNPLLGRPAPTEPQFTSSGHNVIGSLERCDVVPQAADFVGDPVLGPFLQDVRPGRAHFPLLPGSPAIDGGDPSACTPADQLGRARLGLCDSGAVELRPISMLAANSLVTFVPLEETLRFAGNLCQPPVGNNPFAGAFLFTARLTNQNGRDLTNLVLQVAELSSGNLLSGAYGDFGVGSFLSLSFLRWTEPLDGRLRPQEAVDVPFAVCLEERAPFRFSVNVFEVSEPDE